jgi:hypothetical protein
MSEGKVLDQSQQLDRIDAEIGYRMHAFARPLQLSGVRENRSNSIAELASVFSLCLKLLSVLWCTSQADRAI